MQKIPLKRAKAGMVLAMDIFRSDSPIGIPVCGKGTELTEALIARFANMDIASVYVAGHPVWEEGGKSIDDFVRELDDRFSKTTQEPLNAMLHKIYKTHLIKSMGGESDRKSE